jgi:hypothetical protein
MQGPEHAEDPQPEPPRCFLDRPQVQQIVESMHGSSGASSGHAPSGGRDRYGLESPPDRCADAAAPAAPEAEAQARNFFAAPRRAYLGDGSEWNWTICRTWFPASP